MKKVHGNNYKDLQVASMQICSQCGAQCDEKSTKCGKCGFPLDSGQGPVTDAEGGANNDTDDESAAIPQYSVPLSILVSDAHTLIYSWLEAQQQDTYERENFHILRMNKKYYGCWLFWYIVSENGDKCTGLSMEKSDLEAPQETQKRTKIILVPGSNEIPQEVVKLSVHYDFMELCELDEKVVDSSEFVVPTLDESEAQKKALEKLKAEEPALFDYQGRLQESAKLSHSVSVFLPVWEGAYDYRGGREYTFFINGQKGQIEGEEFTKDRNSYLAKVAPYSWHLAALVTLLLIAFLFITRNYTLRDDHGPSPGISVTAPASPAATVSVSPAAQTPGTLSPSPGSSLPVMGLSPSPGGSPPGDEDSRNALNAVLENIKAIDSKDFAKVLALRSDRIRKEKDAAFYENRYLDNMSLKVVEYKVESCTPEEARITVVTEAEDRYGSKTRRITSDIKFILIRESGDWRIDDSTERTVKIIEE
ncbi:MAG: zinc ribbon domain-containing protein [Candidatus Eremiobacteraeota bacterium]|nr:zinc ribbon domain-containing protein [Candidatus Eremiobacteraeota bacterium]